MLAKRFTIVTQYVYTTNHCSNSPHCSTTLNVSYVGTFKASDPNTISDRLCIPCPTGTYRSDAMVLGAQPGCMRHTACARGMAESAPGTRATDRACVPQTSPVATTGTAATPNTDADVTTSPPNPDELMESDNNLEAQIDIAFYIVIPALLGCIIIVFAWHYCCQKDKTKDSADFTLNQNYAVSCA